MPLDPPVTSTMGRGARATDPGVIAATTPAFPFARASLKDYRFGQRAIGKSSLPGPRLLRLEVAVLDPIAGLEAETLGREELEETKIGRLAHKIEKLKIIADRIPGVEFLKTEAFSGENGIALQDYAPFGVIGVITPVTRMHP